MFPELIAQAQEDITCETCPSFKISEIDSNYEKFVSAAESYYDARAFCQCCGGNIAVPQTREEGINYFNLLLEKSLEFKRLFIGIRNSKPGGEIIRYKKIHTFSRVWPTGGGGWGALAAKKITAKVTAPKISFLENPQGGGARHL